MGGRTLVLGLVSSSVGVVVMVVLLVFGLVVIPGAVDKKIKEAARLPDDTSPDDVKQDWYSSGDADDVPVYVKYYLYHIDNLAYTGGLPSGYTDGRPKMVEKGPYVYREVSTKYDVSYPNGGEEVQYKSYNSYTFEPSMSAGAEDDYVTNFYFGYSAALGKIALDADLLTNQSEGFFSQIVVAQGLATVIQTLQDGMPLAYAGGVPVVVAAAFSVPCVSCPANVGALAGALSMANTALQLAGMGASNFTSPELQTLASEIADPTAVSQGLFDATGSLWNNLLAAVAASMDLMSYADMLGNPTILGAATLLGAKHTGLQPVQLAAAAVAMLHDDLLAFRKAQRTAAVPHVTAGAGANDRLMAYAQFGRLSAFGGKSAFELGLAPVEISLGGFVKSNNLTYPFSNASVTMAFFDQLMGVDATGAPLPAHLNVLGSPIPAGAFGGGAMLSTFFTFLGMGASAPVPNWMTAIFGIPHDLASAATIAGYLQHFLATSAQPGYRAKWINGETGSLKNQTVRQWLYEAMDPGLCTEAGCLPAAIFQTFDRTDATKDSDFGTGEFPGYVIQKTGKSDASIAGEYVMSNGKTEWPLCSNSAVPDKVGGKKSGARWGADTVKDSPKSMEWWFNIAKRTLVVDFEADTVLKEIDTKKYVDSPSNWKSSNEMFPGFVDVSCLLKAPMYFSKPYWTHDVTFRAGLQDYPAATSAHDWFFEVEPRTGLTMKTANRAQLNLLVLKEFHSIMYPDTLVPPTGMMVPFVWFELVGEIPDEDAKTFVDGLKSAQATALALAIVGGVLGGGCFLFGAAMVVVGAMGGKNSTGPYDKAPSSAHSSPRGGDTNMDPVKAFDGDEIVE